LKGAIGIPGGILTHQKAVDRVLKQGSAREAALPGFEAERAAPFHSSANRGGDTPGFVTQTAWHHELQDQLRSLCMPPRPGESSRIVEKKHFSRRVIQSSGTIVSPSPIILQSYSNHTPIILQSFPNNDLKISMHGRSLGHSKQQGLESSPQSMPIVSPINPQFKFQILIDGSQIMKSNAEISGFNQPGLSKQGSQSYPSSGS